MAPGVLRTRVVRVPVRASVGAPPSSISALKELTYARVLDEAVDVLAGAALDGIGYASTSSG
jgi:hypothetical protein